MHTKPAYDTGLDEGVRHGWIEALGYVLTVLDDEIQFHKENWEGAPTSPTTYLDRLHLIFSHRRKL